jgi:glucokinase
MNARLLAFDIGGTKIRAARVENDALVDVATEPTPRRGSAIVARLIAVTRQMAGTSTLDGIGVSATGQVDATGTIVGSTRTLVEWAGTPLARELETVFAVPVVVVNDAKAAAVALWHQTGGGRVLVVTLGTGVGGGLVYEDGRFESGRSGRGGEFGHTLFRYGGARCPCGRRGCVEAYLAGTAIVRRARRALPGRRWPDLAAVVAEAAEPRIRRLWEAVGQELAAALIAWDLLFECDRYIIAGGVTRAASLFWPALEDGLRRDGRIAPTQVTLDPLGDDAFLLGAARVWEQRFGKRPS